MIKISMRYNFRSLIARFRIDCSWDTGCFPVLRHIIGKPTEIRSNMTFVIEVICVILITLFTY